MWCVSPASCRSSATVGALLMPPILARVARPAQCRRLRLHGGFGSDQPNAGLMALASGFGLRYGSLIGAFVCDLEVRRHEEVTACHCLRRCTCTDSSGHA